MSRIERFSNRIREYASQPKRQGTLLGGILRPLSYGITSWWAVLLMVAGAMVYGVAHMGKMMAIRPGVDQVLPNIKADGMDFWGPLWLTIGILVVGTFAEAIGKSTKRFFSQYISYRTAIGIWRELFRKTLHQEMGFFGRWKVGDLIHRMNDDVNRTLEILKLVLDDLVMAPFLLISGAVIVLYASWQLAIFTIVAVTFLGYPLYRLGKIIRKQAKKRQDFHAGLTQDRMQMLTGFKTIKMFGREEQEADRFDGRSETFFRKAMRVFRSKCIVKGGTPLVTGIVAAAGAIGGLMLIRHDIWGLTEGRLILFVAATNQLFKPIQDMSKAYSKMNDSLASCDRVFDYLDAMDIPQDRGGRSLNGVEPSVAFEDVTFSYGDGAVLDGVSFEAKAGEVVAIVGTSGGGKTTLLDLAARLYRPQTGRVTVGGIDVQEFALDDYLANLGIVPQEPFLFANTVRENIAFGKPDATDEEIVEAATIANIHDFITTLPDGYDTVLGERGQTVSGGQRQRIATARAVIKDARILLLDEATSALDAESEKAFYNALERLISHGDKTVLIVAHRLSTVTNADRILVLENGRIVEQGTHEELIKSGRIYRRLFETQFNQPENS